MRLKLDYHSGCRIFAHLFGEVSGSSRSRGTCNKYQLYTNNFAGKHANIFL